MCGGGGGFLGDVVSTISDTITTPIENTINSVETLVTDPTKLTLGNAVDLALPVGGALVRDAVDNPTHAAVQAGLIAGGAALGSAFPATTASKLGADGFALEGAHVTVAPTLTPIATDLASAPLAAGAAGAAGGSGGGFLATLGATSLAQTLTGLGQKAQGILAAIPGATSFLPSLAQTAHAAEAPGGFTAALGQNEAAPAPTPNDTARSLLIGTAVVALPLGGIGYFAWRVWKRSRRA